jgi:tetratricopeptide (TPR) repeat protein
VTADSDDQTEATKREGHASSQSVKVKPEEPHVELARGTLVGRYVLLDKLGEGGMGVVYGAYDPELDRKVAIKVLQPNEEGGSTGGDQAWLLREAQALARLAHPNIVAVHDVGTLSGDQVFVAMELVEGGTLRAWLKAKARTWREVLAVMRASGAGLAAAHKAGLVHRDFKPENVLVGSDGRVRVMDFGLARLRPGEGAAMLPSPSSGSDSGHVSPLSADLTMAGHVVGTPAYMAPEIYDDHAADARTDQFAFGVTLFEGLFQTRPYDKRDLQPTRSAPPKPKLPSEARVPARLKAIALRAIAIDREQRFTSMAELLDELAIDPMARRRRAVFAALGVVALAGAAAASVAIVGSTGSSPACKGLDKRLVGVWDAPAKDTIRRGFLATKLPLATESYAAVAQGLDAYTREWVATATDACEAMNVRRDQTAEVFALREQCIDERLDELASFSHELATPSKSLVEKAGKAVTELEPVARCSNVTALRAPDQMPPALAPKVRELLKRLATAKAQLINGNYIGAGASAASVAREAKEIGYTPLASEAEFIRATSLMVAQSFDEAATAYRGTTWSAMQGRRDDLLVNGALSLASLDVQSLSKPAEAQIWLELAQAAAKRLGTLDLNTEMRMLQVQGVVASLAGDHATAIAAHGKVLVLSEQRFGHDSPMLFENEEVYAATLSRAFQYADAVPHYERALALRERMVGPDHSDIALILSNLGLCFNHLRDPRARPTFERAIAMREKMFGKNSPILVPTLDNYGDYLRHEHDIPAALAVLDRALRLAKVFPGPDTATYHQVATDYAETLAAGGRARDAHALYDSVLALEAKIDSPTRPVTLTSRAELALAERKWSDAEADAEHAVSAFEAIGGKDNPELWRPLTDLARARIELRKPAGDIRPLLERASAIGTRIKLADDELAPTRDALARLR